jgi:diacylglycerol kinase (ATP)
VFKGTHTSHPKVKIMRGARVSISSDRGLLVLGDGEELGTLPASFAAVPKALRVISP